MPSKIFMLYSCDEWKSKSSVILVTTSKARLKEVILECIQNYDMGYSDGSKICLTVDEQIGLLNRDWEQEDERVFNDRLRYGYFKAVTDGELL